MLHPTLPLNLRSGGKGGEGQKKTISNVTLLSIQQFEHSPYGACILMMDFELCDLVTLRVMSTKLVYHNTVNIKSMKFISKTKTPNKEKKKKYKRKPELALNICV